jgi:hypothetical protein
LDFTAVGIYHGAAVFLVAFLIVGSSPAFCENDVLPEDMLQKLLPPNVTKVGFLGDLLAVIAFCNLNKEVDQYELLAGMRAFGISSADRTAMEAIRDKQYGAYRREFSTASKHQAFCADVASISPPGSRNHLRSSFLTKLMRSGVPFMAGSDYRRQSEKIEFFGDLLGTLQFCRVPVEAQKLGSFLFYMGIQSESTSALKERTAKRYKELGTEYGVPDDASEVCKEVAANQWVRSLVKP